MWNDVKLVRKFDHVEKNLGLHNLGELGITK